MVNQEQQAESAQQIQIWFESVAPRHTVTRAGFIAPVAVPDSVEASYVAGANLRRQYEFHTGRRLARAALEALGHETISIPPSPDRDPVWPPGVIGSISHTRTIGVAHVASAQEWRGVGIDIEPQAPVDNSFASLICHPSEPKDHALLRFVVKEAFFKAYYPQTRCFLEFEDVWVDFGIDWFKCELVAPEKPSLNERRSFSGPCAKISGNYVAGLWCAQ